MGIKQPPEQSPDKAEVEGEVDGTEPESSLRSPMNRFSTLARHLMKVPYNVIKNKNQDPSPNKLAVTGSSRTKK